MCERERVGYDGHDLDCCLGEMDGNERMRMRDGGGVACPTAVWWTVETADRPPRWEWQWQRQRVAVGGWNWLTWVEWGFPPPGEEEVRRR